MNRNRRDFMKDTGAVAAFAMAGGLPAKLAAAKPTPPAESRGMAHGLTLLNIRSGADYRLAALARLVDRVRSVGADFDAPLKAPYPHLCQERLSTRRIDSSAETGYPVTPEEEFALSRLRCVESAFGEWHLVLRVDWTEAYRKQPEANKRKRSETRCWVENAISRVWETIGNVRQLV